MVRWLSSLAVVIPTVVLAQVPPEQTLTTFTTPPGLAVQLFAAEPMLVNPTAIDVDPWGRVWVAEAVNYRRVNFNRPILREAGDRIVILTDTDGDGKADESTVFYQGKELYGPLGVLVLPHPKGSSPKAVRVLVAQSPDILEFVDGDGDGKADGPPTKFLTGFGGFDHDHGIHGLTTGPEGKLYFTVGDQGVTGLQSKDGKGRKFVTTKDATGDVQAGTIFRCDPDGNNLELIAHNFRNNYEAAVDSFGEIWCSDNDDDGNQQTRICHVLPGGNYGYWPRGPGQSHWHEEEPGVVHKTLRTGFGSPTGMCIYEGSLMPELTGQIVHCDAGPREVRAFQRVPQGAGYRLDKTLLLTSTDPWFRASDVCAAPDGSLFVADWYDPGVGGHGMGDHTRGRIYRLAPKGQATYKVPTVDLERMSGLRTLMESPCTSSRAFAQYILTDVERGELMKLARSLVQSPNVLVKARVHAYIPHVLKDDSWQTGVQQALGRGPSEKDARFRTLAVRTIASKLPGLDKNAATDFGQLTPEITARMDAATRRELLVSSRLAPLGERTSDTFYRLAKLYDAKDQVYRAALNIALGTDPERRAAILADFPKHFPEWDDAVADLVWELRPAPMVARIGELLRDPSRPESQKARMVEILATSPDVSAAKTLLTLLPADQPPAVRAAAARQLELFLPNKWKSLKDAPEFATAVDALLAGQDPVLGARLVAASWRYPALRSVVRLAEDAQASPEARSEAIRTLGVLKGVPAVQALGRLTDDATVGSQAVVALAEQLSPREVTPATKAALAALEPLLAGPDAARRQSALEGLARSRTGTGHLLALKEKGTLPGGLHAEAGRLLRASPFQGERNKAMLLFPAPAKLDIKRLPPSAELAKRDGDPARGRQLMAQTATGELQCLKCHQVNGQGGLIGPDLSLIGKKASKENLYDSLIHPSKAIADQYVTWAIETDEGQVLTGLLVGETETELTIRDGNGTDTRVPREAVVSQKKSLVSLMPEGLVQTLTEDELADLVAYLTTLQTSSYTPDSWQLHGPMPIKSDADIDRQPAELPESRLIRADAAGYFDLAKFHGDKAANSMTVLTTTVVSPVEQSVTISLGTDDGCRLEVNGEVVFRHARHEAATPGRDRVPVRLRPGANAVRLSITNGDGPHGFYLSVVGGTDLAAK